MLSASLPGYLYMSSTEKHTSDDSKPRNFTLALCKSSLLYLPSHSSLLLSLSVVLFYTLFKHYKQTKSNSLFLTRNIKSSYLACIYCLSEIFYHTREWTLVLKAKVQEFGLRSHFFVCLLKESVIITLDITNTSISSVVPVNSRSYIRSYSYSLNFNRMTPPELFLTKTQVSCRTHFHFLLWLLPLNYHRW